MSTGRIEGDRGDAKGIVPSRGALTPIKPFETPKPSEAKRSENKSDARSSETRPAGAPSEITEADAAAAVYLEFEDLIEEAGKRKAKKPRSPRRCVADFVEPRIPDPTVFQGGRSLEMLERLAAEIIPGLDESEELRNLASAIIADEIKRYIDLANRLLQGGLAV
jgi:hypothetical protein